MFHKKFYAILIILFVLAVNVSYAGEGKVGPIAQLDSDSIILRYDKPIKNVYVLFKASDNDGDLDVLLFIQALRARLSQKGFSISDAPEKADVLLSLDIKKIDKEYWFGLPMKHGHQRRITCLSVDTAYETARGQWNKEFVGHKGYWTFKGEAYYRNTMTNDLARAVVNPLHDYTKEKELINAAGEGNVKAVLGFVNGNINVNADNDLGYTPLIAASKNGHSEIVRLLLSFSAAVNAKDNDGWSALTYTAYNGDEKNAVLLLENGANVDSENFKNVTALEFAVLQGHSSIVSLLLSHNANIGNALKYAQQKGNKELARVLSDYEKTADQSIDYNCGYLTGLIKNENNEKIQSLIKNDLAVVDPKNDRCKDAMIAAARKGNIEVIEFLLGKGIGAGAENNSGDAAILAAAEEGHIEIIKMLISEGADLYYFGSSALASAAGSGQKEAVEYFLSEDVDINARGRFGDTAGEMPLGEAARAGKKEMIELLLSKGAKVNSENKDGKTALMQAALAGKAEVVGLLLSLGADVDQKDKEGLTALDLMSKIRRQKDVDDIDYGNVIDILKKNKLEQGDKRARLRSVEK